MVHVKELNRSRISDLVKRSDWSILNKFALEVILQYENKEKSTLPYSKAITSIYRCDRRTLVRGQNQILQDALIRTLAATDDYTQPEDNLLREHLMQYHAVKTAKKCPMAFLTENRDDHESK
jgi:hypothetical protein